MSAARDLCLLLREKAPATWVLPGLVGRLMEGGRTRIEALVGGRDAPEAVADLRLCRDLVSAALPAAPETPSETGPTSPDERTQRLIASRLLLLADAPIRLPRSPERSGQPQAGR
jgi:hypothetical protein